MEVSCPVLFMFESVSELFNKFFEETTPLSCLSRQRFKPYVLNLDDFISVLLFRFSNKDTFTVMPNMQAVNTLYFFYSLEGLVEL